MPASPLAPFTCEQPGLRSVHNSCAAADDRNFTFQHHGHLCLISLPPVQPLYQVCPVSSPRIADRHDIVSGRLAQRNWSVVRGIGVSLDDHAMVQQYVKHAEQRQFRAAAGTASTGEGPPTLPDNGPG